jgi:diguanylate cyclase (GGDEF)-like protein
MSEVPKFEILIAEDSLPQAFALRVLLQDAGYGVSVACNGQEALKILEKKRCDMIITDIEMPVMNGYEMCGQIKQRPEWRSIPIILLTTLSDPANIVLGLQAKADHYLTKPYSPKFLLAHVKTLLEQPPAPEEEEVGPIEVTIESKHYFVSATPRQMLNLLLSTYDNAVQQNRELVKTQYELHEKNTQLREQQERLREANLQLQALATTDGLTGLKNHRTFKEKLEEEFQRAFRYSLPLSILMVDVDRFKQFNDAFGHPEGDVVLRTVSRLLVEQTRNTDFVARYGGEEFVVLLPNTANHEALLIGERLRLAIEQAQWSHRAITASIGAASLNPSVQNAPALLQRADQALYSAKSGGRNKLCHAADAPAAPNS